MSRFVRYRLIEYRSSRPELLDDVVARSLDGTHADASCTITATEIDGHQLTVSLERALQEARERPPHWPARNVRREEPTP